MGWDDSLQCAGECVAHAPLLVQDALRRLRSHPHLTHAPAHMSIQG